ncbi:hypothetical protein SIN8267_01434 [Sinobacterium norvegicum]|uniref:Uncharacterized protein n=1 Tax=Sinobacterium norvegicum TaxID=1641715 RepID=A0ABM9AF28_9GAMM|nr:hypothetical protein [Sinobacterium norvegicum]CAH0991331.1 hypothetical protein SIN8267_01434 [Sinobacterium norvegicum]
MSHSVKSHITREVITNGVTNSFFNGVIAWMLLKEIETITLWQEHSIAIDMAATAAILLFILTVIIIPLNRSKLRKGKIIAAEWNPASRLHRILMRFPQKLWQQGLMFALCGIVLVAPISVLPFMLTGITEMTGSQYAIVKGVWAGLMAAIMVIPMIILALAPADNKPTLASA